MTKKYLELTGYFPQNYKLLLFSSAFRSSLAGRLRRTLAAIAGAPAPLSPAVGFVYRCPGTLFRLGARNAALAVAFLDMFRLPLLLSGVFRFVSLGHNYKINLLK